MVIEANCWYGILLKGAISHRFDKSGFTSILQADDGNFELLIEEFGLEPSE